MKGRTLEEARRQMLTKGMPPAEVDRIAPHRVFPGNRPSLTILYRKLDPDTLGRLIALYEHRVFVEAQLFGINAFDQWGVELGKELATGAAARRGGQGGCRKARCLDGRPRAPYPGIARSGVERGDIKGIMFDKDGTLVDFQATWFAIGDALALRAAAGDRARADGLLERAGYDFERQCFRGRFGVRGGHQCRHRRALVPRRRR